MAKSPPQIIYGAPGVAEKSPEELKELFATLQKHNVKILDTASIYPGSEATLGQYGAPKEFTIHTKAPGLVPGCLAKQSVLDAMKKSLEDLGVDYVDTYYLHAPDTATPIEDTLLAIQELYASKKFRKFGLSNYLAEDVQKIYDIQSAAHSVLPTMYQGNYNAVARHSETILFPLLRKLNISFAAYSPIAGGFLTKSSADLRAKNPSGRFVPQTMLGDMYATLYGKESLLQALDEWDVIAADAGISKVALAYRWVVWHSALDGAKGDGVVIGARGAQQLQETLGVIEQGPLREGIAERASAIWEKVKDEVPRDNFNDYLAFRGWV